MRLPHRIAFTALAATFGVAVIAQTGRGVPRVTDLLTSSERSASGLSKLSPEELRALNNALFRVFMTIQSLPTSPSPSSVPGGKPLSSDDLNFFDSQGRPAVFLDPKNDMTFFLWSGEPVAYLDKENVYGFNGKHLGWLHDGLVYDHNGAIVVAPARAFRVAPPTPSAHGFEQFTPFRAFEEFEPFQPFLKTSWSSTSALVFFAAGK